jgi:hypothetical protein
LILVKSTFGKALDDRAAFTSCWDEGRVSVSGSGLLLGRSSRIWRAIRRASYNPLSPQAREAVLRIRRFHQVVADHSAKTFPTLVMNDGACAYFDLSYRTRWPTYDFLQRSKALFDAIQLVENESGLPGARMVISTGFRLRGRALQRSARRGEFVKGLIKRVNDKKISWKEGLTTASKFSSPFDIVPHLQANFAFTKSYIAEQTGTAGGLPGPACYVDGALFDSAVVSSSDMCVGDAINWQSDKYGLAATFHKLEFLRTAKQTEIRNAASVHHGPEGFRDALAVAKFLTGDDNVLDALRRARTESKT